MTPAEYRALPRASSYAGDKCPVCCARPDMREAVEMLRVDGEGTVDAECADCGEPLVIETYAVRDDLDGATLEHEVKTRRAEVTP